MSLVICSNQSQDGRESRNRNSISKPWAFRNTLSSTYKIPQNAQVALSSCKVTIPERVVVGGNGNKLYHWIGTDLSDTVSTADTTSWPVLVELSKQDSSYEDMSVDDFTDLLESKIEGATFHPNYKGNALVSVKKNATTGLFEGYDISYDQNGSTTNVNRRPLVANTFKQWFGDVGAYGGATSQFFTYSGSSTYQFQRTNTSGTAVGDYAMAAGINIDRPLSLAEGVFEVEFGEGNGNANASGVEWHAGLSRWIRPTNPGQRTYIPDYDITDGTLLFGFEATQFNNMYMDFGVCRAENDELVVYQHSRLSDNTIIKKEVRYWENSNSSYTGAARFNLQTGTKAAQLSRARFTVSGERVALHLYDKVTTLYHLVTEYDAGEPAGSYFKPVNQSCWCLHPVLCVGRLTGAETSTLGIKQFDGMDITGYDPTVAGSGGWYENNKILGLEDNSRQVDCRDLGTYVQKGLNASAGVAYNVKLIVSESDLYSPSFGANAQDLLGFTKAIVNPTLAGSLNSFSSTSAPSLACPFALFVKINNLGQQSMNALQGNQSKILAHLTTLEDKTGKLTHEPSNLVWINLNNAAPLNITEFDISFNYINEQYAEVLVGQSIVSIIFRAMPKELM